MLNNQNRLSQADVFQEFGITSKFKIQIKNEELILEKFALERDRYILLQSGIGKMSMNENGEVSTREWSIDNFNKLCSWLQKIYPQYKLVQIGYDNNSRIENVDIDLCGKTDFEEVLAITASAKLLISIDTGIVHFRHFSSQKQSVVLFGPTTIKMVGYPENINISAEVCGGCEWMHKGWNKKCLLTGQRAKCMEELKPEIVLNIISKGM